MDFSAKILEWYKQNKRVLPWRQTKDPYKIWISEIILQQTRVNQGINYYNRFVNSLPNVDVLAKSSLDNVLKLWQGLGYYSRARNIHTAAISIYNNGGVMPNSYKKLLLLKGIGEYTAAAIASIAYNEPVALVDGNVFRVLSRVFGINTPINESRAKKEFLDKATELLDKNNPGDHNQAIMELGALICLPQNPQCSICPLRNNCFALKKNLTNELPVNLKKGKVRIRYFYYLILVNATHIIVRKRTDKDIWQDLYDFPLIESKKKLSKKELSQSIQNLFDQKKYSIEEISHEYKHKLSHQTINAQFIRIKNLVSLRNINSEWQLIKHTDLKKYALPKLIENYLRDSGFIL